MSGDPVMNAARFKPPRAVPTLSPCFTMDQLDLVPDHSSIIVRLLGMINKSDSPN